MSKDFKVNIGTQLGNEDGKFADRLSPFGITINPNISTVPGTEAHQRIHDKLLECCQELFGTEEAFKANFIFLIKGHSWNDKYIKEIEAANITVEYGKLKKLHIQASLHIIHRTKLQVDKKKLEDHVANKLGIDSNRVYCHIQTRYNDQPNRTAIERARDYPLKNRN